MSSDLVSTVVFSLAGADPDTDGDGIADSLHNCSLIANALQRDSNGDGFGNRCDGDFEQ